MAAEAASLGALQVQQSTHLFALRHRELPDFGVMIGVDEVEEQRAACVPPANSEGLVASRKSKVMVLPSGEIVPG
jgi:hypothetical protein